MPWFEFLDRHPALYWAVGWTLFGLCLAAAGLARPGDEPARRPLWGHPVIFGALVVATLCAFRWPSWFVPREINPDESQIIAGAITLRDSPVFWKSVDGTTHGPLNEYLLAAASVCGWPLTFGGARVMAVLLIAGALLAAYGALRRFLPEPLARLGIVPGLAFWSFSWFGDFLHFSSELVAVTLMAAATWGLATALTADRLRPGVLGFTGAILALVPLAKLQATPLALVFGLSGLGVLAWQRAAGWQQRALCLAGGAVAVALGLLAFLAVYGLWPQFWVSYVLSNLNYSAAGSHPLGEMPNYFFVFMATGYSFAWFFHGSAAFVLLYARAARSEGTPALRVALLVGWLASATAYFCVLAPRREVAHYLQLLVIPLMQLAALHLATGSTSRQRRVTLLAFLVLAIGAQIPNRLLAVQEQLGHLAENQRTPISPGGAFIRERMQPGERLTVWGWNAQLHVETQLPQGTREAHTAFQIMQGPLRDFYRERFLRDMQRRKPEWFVDAVGPHRFAFEYRHIDGHETVGELDQLIRDQYVLLTEVDSMRIYHRRP